jgi:hypothetical protein
MAFWGLSLDDWWQGAALLVANVLPSAVRQKFRPSVDGFVQTPRRGKGCKYKRIAISIQVNLSLIHATWKASTASLHPHISDLPVQKQRSWKQQMMVRKWICWQKTVFPELCSCVQNFPQKTFLFKSE